jgi:hypothetical protein
MKLTQTQYLAIVAVIDAAKVEGDKDSDEYAAAIVAIVEDDDR